MCLITGKRSEVGETYPVLLVVDGHNSRLNPDLLMHCLCEDVIVLNLPSHLTHLLQPNDAGVNRLLKCLLDEELLQHLEAKITVTQTVLAGMLIRCLNNSRMKMAIVQSYAHCGICPVDVSRAASLLADEAPSVALERDESVQMVLKLTKDHLDKLIRLNESSKRLSASVPATARRQRLFSQSRVQNITRMDNLARMKLDNMWTKVREMKCEELHAFLLAVGHEPSTLYKDGTTTFKIMDDLRDMERERLHSLIPVLTDSLDAIRRQRYEAQRLPSLPDLLGQPQEEVMDSGSVPVSEEELFTVPGYLLEFLEAQILPEPVMTDVPQP